MASYSLYNGHRREGGVRRVRTTSTHGRDRWQVIMVTRCHISQLGLTDTDRPASQCTRVQPGPETCAARRRRELWHLFGGSVERSVPSLAVSGPLHLANFGFPAWSSTPTRGLTWSPPVAEFRPSVGRATTPRSVHLFHCMRAFRPQPRTRTSSAKRAWLGVG